MNFVRAVGVLMFILATYPALAENEIALFDSAGEAVAYVAVDDDLTIYLWSGKPVAYLTDDSGGGYNVYGFNGKHLGWFLKGIIWDHTGNASCAVKEAFQATEMEPLKALKELQPLKSLQELAPLRPLPTNSFGDLPCQFLLGEGAS